MASSYTFCRVQYNMYHKSQSDEPRFGIKCECHINGYQPVTVQQMVPHAAPVGIHYRACGQMIDINENTSQHNQESIPEIIPKEQGSNP